MLLLQSVSFRTKEDKHRKKKKKIKKAAKKAKKAVASASELHFGIMD